MSRMKQMYFFSGQRRSVIFLLVAIVGFFTLLGQILAAPDPAPGIAAELVLGQTTFTASSTVVASATSLLAPSGVHVRGNSLYVADSANNRVLIWTSLPTAHGQAADIVLGQTSMTGSGAGTTTTTLNNPTSVMSDGSKIYVADSNNNRVMIWNTTTPTNGQAADRVLGQANFTSGGSGTTASTFNAPTMVYSDGSKIYVADIINSRVLIWNTTTPTNGQAADRVLGQADFTSGVGSASQTQLSAPQSIHADGSKIYVLDSGNNRVMIWNTTTPTNGQAADRVLGQADFTSFSSSTAAGRLWIGYNSPGIGDVIEQGGVYADADNIYVSDPGNHRIMVWRTTTPSNGATADVVIGKSTFTNDTLYDTSSTTFNLPRQMAVSSGRLYVADTSNHRVLRFSLAPSTSTQSISSIATSSFRVSIETNTAKSFAQYALYSSTLNLYLTASNTLTSASSVWQATSTWSNPTITGLTPGTAYSLSTLGRYVIDVRATSTLEVATNPEAASLTTSNATTSTIDITLATATNGVTTTYAIFNTTTGQYLHSDGSSTTTAGYFASSTWGSAIRATGLTANTRYQFVTVARAGGVNAATSSATTALATLANVPSGLTMVGDTNTTITIGWTGDATDYYAENTTASTTSGWVTSTTYTFTSLTCGTSYTFRVKGRNVSGVETSFTSTLSGNSGGCPSSGRRAVEPPRPVTVPPTPEPPAPFEPRATPACTLSSHSAYKQLDHPGVFYITDDCRKRPFPNPEIFFSYFASWQDVKIVTPGILERVPDHVAGFMAMGHQPPKPADTPERPFTRPLWFGSEGRDVERLQSILRDHGYMATIPTPGSYDRHTVRAVKRFQVAHRLPAVGSVGPRTRAVLNAL